ncbi:hypothetical protein G9A89_008453 [Geosiphon pyriformis]|nr:hypothetical protein G9A89_008453 [Geosiphon pyriformis]
MASVDRVERELGDAKTEYRRCVEELKEFRKGEKGDRLEELKKNLREKEDVDEKQRKKWTEEKEELEEEANDLKVEKNEWKAQFKEKLMNKNPNSRPTANDALKDEWFNLPEEQLSIMEA